MPTLPSTVFRSHIDAIKALVLANHALNPRVFGSVAQGVDTVHSDLDLLVDTTSETTLFDIARLKIQLKQLMGCDVDVLTPMAIAPAMRENIYAQCVAL